MGLFEKLKQGLGKTRDSLGKAVDNVLATFTKIDEDLFEGLEEVLLLADIGLDASEEVLGQLRERVKLARVTDPAEIRGMLAEIMKEQIETGEEEPMRLSTKPSVLLVVGVNGVGKTTTIGKLSAYFAAQGKKVLLGAADTFRAAAADQLKIWADRTGADLVRHQEGSDPAAVVFDSIAAGKSRGADVIICDTAGRLHNKKNLMNELNKIFRVIERELPNCNREVLLVIDATTGQNGLSQAREFLDAAPVTGLVLTKLDGTAKGGIVVAIHRELGLPVRFVGVGEGVDDLQPFDAAAFAEAIVG
ncbi:MAG: signal recognition particle-docking protein FtsY [Clostridia bacterium]|jgi:fused signal recognition particle receptor|nr:signal recognition particle-docking protein FtsY [Clostridia bacterium]MBQ6000716.1 signal recognition particle-docking protein FtsY [Clostridia bacterium]